jgi:anti-sigma regulatory factor (Ser/Thr protein kinase)
MADDALAVDTTATLSDVRWEKTYDGLPTTVSCVRRDVRAILCPCPEAVLDDVVLMVSELATNAIRHSRSGGDGGTYTVRVSHQATQKIPYIWIEVLDQGSPSWDGTLRPEPTHGLSLVQHLSTWMGTDDEPDGRRTVYARLDYRADGTPLYGTSRVPTLPLNLDGVRESSHLSRRSTDMTAASCVCGFTELADEEMTDHLLRVFEPDDHVGHDGQAHEEREPLTCICGLMATTPDDLDAHLLQVFTPDDAKDRDGQLHEPAGDGA